MATRNAPWEADAPAQITAAAAQVSPWATGVRSGISTPTVTPNPAPATGGGNTPAPTSPLTSSATPPSTVDLHKSSGFGKLDDSVASHVAKLQSEDSALMRGAAAAGTRAANRRGLINSSMGIGAGISAGLGAVVPIASQDAQQNFAKNVAVLEDDRARDTTSLGIMSQDRGNYLQAMTNLATNAQNSISNTLQNNKIPAATRSAAQRDISSLYRSSMQQISTLYGVNLTWG